MAARFFVDPRGRSCATCTDQLRRQRNCDGRSNPAFREVWQGTVVQRCPLAEITPFSRRAVKAFLRWREHHVLPRAGGAGDQDARLIEGLDLLAAEFAELAARQVKTEPKSGR